MHKAEGVPERQDEDSLYGLTYCSAFDSKDKEPRLFPLK